MRRLAPRDTGWGSSTRRTTPRQAALRNHLLREVGCCAVCRGTTGLELDHIVPVADGGADELENVQLLCGKHHRIKTMKDRKARRERRKAESVKPFTERRRRNPDG